MVARRVYEDHQKDGGGVSLLFEVLFLVDGGADGPDDVRDSHGYHAGEVQTTTPGLVDQQGSGAGREKAPQRQAYVEDELGLVVCNANGVEDNGQVIGDERISGPLEHREDVEGDQEPVAIPFGRQPFHLAGFLLDLFHFQSRRDLRYAELDQLGVGVAVGVVLGKDISGLLATVHNLLLGPMFTTSSSVGSSHAILADTAGWTLSAKSTAS